MHTPHLNEATTSVGVFRTISEAEAAIQKLLAAGFIREQLTVICSDPVKRASFSAFPQEQLTEKATTEAAASGGVVGALLAGATAVAGLATAGGAMIVFGGAIAAGMGGMVGGLIGAMMGRGIQKDLADYYDQAVTRDHILVEVDDHSENYEAAVARAEQVFAESGAVPVSMPESRP